MPSVLLKIGRVCGKRLDCGHGCSKRAGSNHICACNRKWTLDLGCAHLITGPCRDYRNVRKVCLETCGKLLDCGHPCAEECSSDNCFCHVCFDKHSTVDVSANKKNSRGNETGKLHLAATAPASVNMTATADTHVQQLAGMSGFASTQPVLKLYSKMSSTVGPKLVLRNPLRQITNLAMDVDTQGIRCPCCDPYQRKPAVTLPQHQLDQVKELLAQSTAEKENPSVWDFVKVFKRCVNEHVFPDGQQYCHVCGCPAYGPSFAIFNVNALKFGLVKCSNGHHFDARLPVCNICGMSSSL